MSPREWRRRRALRRPRNSFPGERVQTPTYSDLYCAGFISKQTLPDANFVAGGLQTPIYDQVCSRRHDLPPGKRI